jgi:hypothetical protein
MKECQQREISIARISLRRTACFHHSQKVVVAGLPLRKRDNISTLRIELDIFRELAYTRIKKCNESAQVANLCQPKKLL